MSWHPLQSAAAGIVLDLILKAKPDASTVSTATDATATSHGFVALGVMSQLHASGMSPLDIILLIPTIIQLIQTIGTDVAALIAAINKIRNGG